jgi:hypothetical protein
MKGNLLSKAIVLLLSFSQYEVYTFTISSLGKVTNSHHLLTPHRKTFSTHCTASSAVPMDGVSKVHKKDALTVNTKYGRLNLYGVYYITVLVLLGLPWYLSLTACQVFYKLTGDRFDRMRKLPMFLSQCWGEASMLLTGTRPAVEGKDKLEKFHKE